MPKKQIDKPCLQALALTHPKVLLFVAMIKIPSLLFLELILDTVPNIIPI